MNGAEVIALARLHFGEPTPATITQEMALRFLNVATNQIYVDLSADRLRTLIRENEVPITQGNRGEIPETWHDIIEVYVDDRPAVPVSREVISQSEYGEYDLFSPGTPIFHIDQGYIWVRPSDKTVRAVHTRPPEEITTGTLNEEITDIHRTYHTALSSLIASYMYAQEEDSVQSQLYKAEYVALLRTIPQMEQEA